MQQPLTNKLSGLDHLRTLAITMVFFYHYSGIFGHPEVLEDIASFGWTGVDLFFVLSGYLIAGQLFAVIAKGQNISVREFYIKRFFRIIPAYLVVVTLYFLIPATRERGPLSPLWKYLTFTQNFGLDQRTNGSFSHAWSLCIEEQFYLLLPLLLVCCTYYRIGKRAFWLIPLLVLAGFAARLYSWDAFIAPIMGQEGYRIVWYKWVYYPTYNRLDGLLTGISIAAIVNFLPRLREQLYRYGNLLLIIAIALLTAAWFVCIDPRTFSASIYGFPLVSLGYGVLVMAAISPSCILYRFHSKLSGSIAMLSYAVYLTHKGVIYVTQAFLANHGIAKDSVTTLLICMLTVLLAAITLNRVVERPFMTLRKRILRSK